MKKNLFLALFSALIFSAQAQTAPAHLKYYGFAIIDCGLDDPNDAQVLSNYISEVDSFSNVAEMCASTYTDTMINRISLMNNHCVKPILATSSIFYYLKDNNAPSGSNYDLYPNFKDRWDTFKLINASVLNASKIEVFYIIDEPVWNGVTFAEFDTICKLIKNDFPNIPQMYIEAYTEVSNMQVPTDISWLGFDRYGIYDVSTDPTFLSELATLKSKRSTPNQKIFLVTDDSYAPSYPGMGWQPDTMQYVVQNYYNLAASDTDIIGMVGFTWPGIAVGWLGARSLPQNVTNKNVQLGQLIKANYSPCGNVGIKNSLKQEEAVKIYPNPAREILNFELKIKDASMVRLYNSFGHLVQEDFVNGGLVKADVGNLPAGFYFYRVVSREGMVIGSGKFVKE